MGKGRASGAPPSCFSSQQLLAFLLFLFVLFAAIHAASGSFSADATATAEATAGSTTAAAASSYPFHRLRQQQQLWVLPEESSAHSLRLPHDPLLLPSSDSSRLISQKTHYLQGQLLKTREADAADVNPCSYTVTIQTSCSSPRITRDAISLAFGDAYRNEVYAARLDDPSSGTFERCSTDTFWIQGPCMYKTCYLYLRRSGIDGWTPDWVKVYSSSSGQQITFYYGTPLPNAVWYGFNLCTSSSAGPSRKQSHHQATAAAVVAAATAATVLQSLRN